MAKAILILACIFVSLPMALFFFLRRLAFRGVERREEQYMQRITPSGLVLYSCLTLVLVIFAAAYTLQPNGPLGRFLHDPAGLLAAIVFTIAAASIAEVCLRRIGSPTMRGKDDRGV